MIPNVMPQENPVPKKSRKWSKLIFLIIIAIAAGSVFQMLRLQKEISRLKDPKIAEQDQLEKALAKVGDLMVLPQGETPSLAVVSDITQLKNQPFFTNAELGDQLIIYTNAKKAILWRPSINKIIEVAPINIDNTQTAAIADSQKTKIDEKVKVEEDTE